MGVQFHCSFVPLNFVFLFLQVKCHDDICMFRCIMLDVDVSAAFFVGSSRMLCVNKNKLVLCVLLID